MINFTPEASLDDLAFENETDRLEFEAAVHNGKVIARGAGPYSPLSRDFQGNKGASPGQGGSSSGSVGYPKIRENDGQQQV